MARVDVLKRVPKGEYWSKSEAFLLPLTGLAKSQKFPMKSYLFWNEYTIENYQIIVVFEYPDYKDFLGYCKRILFPILDKNGYIIESYDFIGKTVFVLDISEWALDIEMFMKGKYSKLSNEVKDRIIDFHSYFDKQQTVKIEISAPLYPNDKYTILGGLTAIEYVAEEYGLNIKDLQEIGELGSIYDKNFETLEL